MGSAPRTRKSHTHCNRSRAWRKRPPTPSGSFEAFAYQSCKYDKKRPGAVIALEPC
jgi:hypothetical protein